VAISVSVPASLPGHKTKLQQLCASLCLSLGSAPFTVSMSALHGPASSIWVVARRGRCATSLSRLMVCMRSWPLCINTSTLEAAEPYFLSWPANSLACDEECHSFQK
jgi:hypothetical protein